MEWVAVALGAIVIGAVFFGLAGLVLGWWGLPFSSSVSPTPLFTPNASVSPYNASCFGKPYFWGYALNRSGQDCTGDGEFNETEKANILCNTYPPEKYFDFAKNLSLYCQLSEPFKGVCCYSGR